MGFWYSEGNRSGLDGKFRIGSRAHSCVNFMVAVLAFVPVLAAELISSLRFLGKLLRLWRPGYASFVRRCSTDAGQTWKDMAT
jgi:hypothetical protein